MDVDVTVDWDYGGKPAAVTEKEAAGLLAHALEREGQGGAWTFALRFVMDDEMRVLHERFMQDASSTDIMTFPYEPEDGEQGGDILISVDTATRNAQEHDWPLADELRFLVLHGLLHILGWDDHDDTTRQAMLNRQAALLASWQESRNP